ncbi:DUF302 domain-containing protein [Dyella halodurans]|uniref:DUF302 domain-containing protein n=1 Tax=Dyella halodurans TaxID=1920171 RepID=A0ABV9C735_9GAMM|nr:DUF302 domain-containing protein [Dyella halodurans]
MSTAHDDQGIVRLRSEHDVPQTMEKLEQLLQAHGVMIFARIDFSGDAVRAGLELRPEQMLIFGNPKAGTPLMQAEPVVGLDLPLKALVWEDEHGTTWIGYNTPNYITQRHGLPAAIGGNLAGAIGLLEQAAH